MKNLYYNHWLKAPKRSSKHSAYFSVYDKVFQELYKKSSVRILEIGVSTGGSIEATASFFASHPNAKIVGLEFNPNVANLVWKSKNIFIEIGNAEKLETFESINAKYGKFDLIIDDGGHTNLQQLRALHASSFLLKKNGALVIEDTQCSYLAEFGNPSKTSIVEVAKIMVDRINARSSIISGRPLEFQVSSIEFSVGMIIFRFDKSLQAKECVPVLNKIKQVGTEDYRFKSQGKSFLRSLIKNQKIIKLLSLIKRFELLKNLLRKAFVFFAKNRQEYAKVRKLINTLLK